MEVLDEVICSELSFFTSETKERRILRTMNSSIRLIPRTSLIVILALQLALISCTNSTAEEESFKLRIAELEQEVQTLKIEKESLRLTANVVDCNRNVQVGQEVIMSLRINPYKDLSISSIEVDGKKLDASEVSSISTSTWLGPYVNLTFEEPGRHRVVLMAYSKFLGGYVGAEHFVKVE